jgi:hypothetical protein
VSDFNEKQLIAELQTWWDDQIALDDPFSEPKAASGTIFDALPMVDSLATVSALLMVAKHVPFRVTPKIIKKGGYTDFDDLVTDMMPKLKELSQKHELKQTKAPGKKQKETT